MAASKAAAKAAARKAEAEAAAQLEKQLALATECAKAEAQVRAEEHLFNLYQQQKVGGAVARFPHGHGRSLWAVSAVAG